MRRCLLVTAVLVVAALVAGLFLGPHVFPSSIATAEDRWFAAARSDYRMTIDHECFCPWAAKFTVTVRSNQPIRMVTARGGGPSIREAGAVGTPLTVEDLFTLAHSLIARYGSENVDITYDPQWGYPVTIQTGGDPDAIDDEISVAVTSFHEGR
jgi:hypothetical protein